MTTVASYTFGHSKIYKGDITYQYIDWQIFVRNEFIVLTRQGLQLPSQPLRELLPVSLLGEQRHDGCEQFAKDC